MLVRGAQAPKIHIKKPFSPKSDYLKLGGIETYPEATAFKIHSLIAAFILKLGLQILHSIVVCIWDAGKKTGKLIVIVV